MHSSERGPKQAIWPGNCPYHFSFVAGEKFVFAKQSHLARDAQFSAATVSAYLRRSSPDTSSKRLATSIPPLFWPNALALVGATVTLALARTPIGEVRAPTDAQLTLAD
jgi:hypothetical protein